MSAEGHPVDRRVSEFTQKEWRRPILQKLPITATAAAKIHFGDEGNCGGKGDSGICPS
jgi:hypothetical protein